MIFILLLLFCRESAFEIASSR